MNFLDVLVANVNEEIEGLGMREGYLGPNECIVVYPLPGGKKETEYMDGAKDIILNCEIAMKSKNGDKINNLLWRVADYLEELTVLESDDFEFNELTVSSKPFINDADEQGWFVFLLDFQASLTTGGKHE